MRKSVHNEIPIWKSGREPGIFSSREWRHGQGKLCKRGRRVNHTKFTCTHTLEHDYSELKDGSAQRCFYVALHETVGRTEFYQPKTVKTHSNNLVVLTHVQLKSLYQLSTYDVTHVRKCTRPSPAFPYCKRWKTGDWWKILITWLEVPGQGFEQAMMLYQRFASILFKKLPSAPNNHS